MPLRAQRFPQQGPEPGSPEECHLQDTCALCHLPRAPCPDPRGLFSPIVSPIAGTILPGGSMVVNSCRSAAEQLCNFICDCSNCSDENQCGYLRGSAVLGTPFTCDFEEGDCGWQDVSTSAYRWVRGRASLATWGTGPHSDHTVGTDLGWFMVTVSPPAKTMATAWLRSPVMREAAATCEIRAWYHLSGSGEGAHGGHGRASGYQAQGSDDGGQWGGMGPSAPMAGTDMCWHPCGASHLLTACHTTPEPGQQVCGAEESRCSRGFCLAQHRFCDGTDDCGDGSDEDATWCSEHPWPWGGGPAHQSADHTDGLRVCAGGGKPGHGAGRGHLSSAAWLCNWRGKITPRVLRRSGISPAHCRDLPVGGRAGTPQSLGQSARGAARDVGPLPQPLRVFPCPGAFLALQAGEGQMVAAARARTPLLGPSGPACAMEMNPAPLLVPGFLTISIVDHTTGTTHLAWHMQGHGSRAGGRVHVPLGERTRPFQEKGHLGDPFAFGVPYPHCLTTITSLRPALSCNFERGMCGWYQDQSSDFKWVRGTGQGQGSDHTTGSGYFMAADPTAPWSRGQRAQLVTYRQEPIATPHCLSFWYRLAGPQIGTLNLKLQLEGAEETVLWTRRGTQGSVWHRGWATLPATGRRQYRVAFEALRDGFLGDMALDDLALTAGPCGAELSCSFEADACGLAASGQRTWLRQSNGTGTTAGPPADHTTGTATGHYMVVSTGRDSLSAGHAAALTSQPYQPSAPAQCLAFWYQLSARTPGFLGVFVEQSGVRRKVMGISTMEGDAWHRGHVTVWPDGDWQVRRSRVPGTSRPGRGQAAGDEGCMAAANLSVPPCPPPAVSCDFERDMCGWSSPSDPRLHSFAWGWKSGVPLAKYPSPEQDHTLGTRNGHYVHFDTSVLGPGGTTAQLESQHLPAAADSCLQFWYHMDIPEHLSCGELRVMLHSVAGQRTVWTVVGHQSQGWRGGVVPVQSPSEFQVSEATLGCRVPSGGAGCPPHASSPEIPSSPVVLGLLAVITLVLVGAGGWYWLKRRGLVSRTPAESNTPQGFDNITFRDVRTGVKGFPACPQPCQNSIFLKVQQIPVGSP
uniref:MAM domain containing 4 n=1 Tax=Aquila chrysaetos chrysaetos TaxID=223781 RepID=A0A663F807_AQUCH